MPPEFRAGSGELGIVSPVFWGLPDPPRNAGKNRTRSKRALLKAIQDAAGEW